MQEAIADIIVDKLEEENEDEENIEKV